MRYGQRIRVQAGLTEWQNRLKVDYLVHDAGDGRRLTTGYTIQCAVASGSGELQLVSPPVLLQRLKDYL